MSLIGLTEIGKESSNHIFLWQTSAATADDPPLSKYAQMGRFLPLTFSHDMDLAQVHPHRVNYL